MISRLEFEVSLSTRLQRIERFMQLQRDKFDNPVQVRQALTEVVSIVNLLVADMSETEVDEQRVGYYFAKAREDIGLSLRIVKFSLPENMARGVKRYLRNYAAQAMKKYGNDVDGFENLLTDTSLDYQGDKVAA